MTVSAEQPVPVGIGIIRRGDRFLVRRRPEGTVYAGYWEFPGGKCEPGECPAAATARECLEETGLAVVVGPLRRITTYRYSHGLVELHFHDCATVNPTAEPAADSGFQWVLAEKLASLRFPEANEAILAELVHENITERDSGSAESAAHDPPRGRSDHNHGLPRAT
jgi:8-oxo-dGTP diphosphatase